MESSSRRVDLPPQDRSIYADAKYKDVPLAEKQRLFDQCKDDLRYEDVLYGFYDFSPRVIAQTMAREDVHGFYELINDSVWDCSQCFSCNRCPRQNSPGSLITVMREVAVNNGLQSAKDALRNYTRVIYKVMSG